MNLLKETMPPLNDNGGIDKQTCIKLNFNKLSFTFSHPDYTVGLGISPSQSQPIQTGSRGLKIHERILTAGREFHPAPKVHILID